MISIALLMKLQDVEQYLAAENRKDQEVIAVRLENIKLKNKLKKKEQQLKSKVRNNNNHINYKL